MTNELLKRLSKDELIKLNFEAIFGAVRIAFCVTDPKSRNEVIFANNAFVELTGYELDELIGRNCKFLQGPETTEQSVELLRQQMRGNQLSAIDIINYRKNGSQFVNSVLIAPISDKGGETVLYFGTQIDVTEERRSEALRKELLDREISHRVRNVVAVLSSIIRTTSSEFVDRDEFVDYSIGRLQALSLAHLQHLSTEQAAEVDAVTLSRQVAELYAPFPTKQLKVLGSECFIRPDAYTPLSLALHEFCANSVKHGAFSNGTGSIEVAWTQDFNQSGLEMQWRETGGPTVSPSDRASGSRIVANIIKRIGGKISYDWNPSGVCIKLNLPTKGA